MKSFVSWVFFLKLAIICPLKRKEKRPHFQKSGEIKDPGRYTLQFSHGLHNHFPPLSHQHSTVSDTAFRKWRISLSYDQTIAGKRPKIRQKSLEFSSSVSNLISYHGDFNVITVMHHNTVIEESFLTFDTSCVIYCADKWIQESLKP